MSTIVLDHDERPSGTASGLALTAALLAVLVVANDTPQLLAISTEVLAVAALWTGAGLSERGSNDATDYRVVAWLLLATGVAAAVGAVVVAATEPFLMRRRLELLPGLLGVTVLALGLLPVRDWTSRRRYLCGAGVGLLVIAVFTSGVVLDAGGLSLLAATALAVIAWDASEQAINLGEQVGRRGETRVVGLVHVGASALVGAVAVLLAVVIQAVNVTGVPLLGLVLLLGAAIILVVALYS